MANNVNPQGADPLDPEERPPKPLLPPDLDATHIPKDRLAQGALLQRQLPDAADLSERPPDLLPEWQEVAKPEDGPCSAETLDGSWYVRLAPIDGQAGGLHGALRIEAKPEFGLQASADLYAMPNDPGMPGDVFTFEPYWYPHLPLEQERWSLEYDSYVRGVEAGLHRGGDCSELALAFVLHPWNRERADFDSGETGGLMVLRCSRRRYHRKDIHGNTVKLIGRARLRGITYDVTACKTAPYQRGCYVFVEEMPDAQWPSIAALRGARMTFTGVFRAHGMDIRGQIQREPHRTIDPLVSDEDFRRINQLGFSSRERAWRMRLVVGLTGETPPGRRVLGVMRDDAPPSRQAAVGFSAERPTDLGMDETKLVHSLRGGRLRDSPLALLRTFLHEAGHAFGLVHAAEVLEGGNGLTIMDPTTGVVASLSPADGLYPERAEFFRFSERDAMMLAHAPDVQVAPGRMQYNWLPALLLGGVLPWPDPWRDRFSRRGGV